VPASRIGTAGDEAAWQAFVERHAACGPYHHFGWKAVIENAYGHECFFLVAEDAGAMSGVLPLAMIRSRIFGNSITSLPYVDYAGVVADDEASRDSLLRFARDIATEHRIGNVELRQTDALPGDYAVATHKVLLTLDLPDSEDALWAGLSSERRNRVRRAEKAGLEVEFAGAGHLPVFYDIWTRNMRDLGSPAHSLGFFREVLERFGDQTEFLLVRHESRYIGAALALYHGATMCVPWVSSLRDSFRLYPNNILYWEAMKRGIARGMKVFDFGRSTVDSGTYEFKRRWGAGPVPLYWHTMDLPGAPAEPAEGSEGFSLAIAVWKKIPVGISRMVGPSLRKNITA